MPGNSLAIPRGHSLGIFWEMFHIASGHDLSTPQAQSGTGKTATFVIGGLQRMDFNHKACELRSECYEGTALRIIYIYIYIYKEKAC